MTSMMTKLSTPRSAMPGNMATRDRATFISRRPNTGHSTLILAWGLVALALAWGFYESLQLLTRVIPRF
jgi:hypothetical protein